MNHRFGLRLPTLFFLMGELPLFARRYFLGSPLSTFFILLYFFALLCFALPCRALLRLAFERIAC